MQFEKIEYSQLNSRQKENFNFQKVSAVLANYGFNTMRLSDDWKGADFIATHINGKEFLKIQLKGRLTLDKKYYKKNIWICFPYKHEWFLYPHDEMVKILKEKNNFTNTGSWQEKGSYHWRILNKELLKIVEKYKI